MGWGCSLIPLTPSKWGGARQVLSHPTAISSLSSSRLSLSLLVHYLHASLYIDSKKGTERRETEREREIAMSVDCMSTPSGEPAARRTCVSPATNSSPCCSGWAKIYQNSQIRSAAHRMILPQSVPPKASSKYTYLQTRGYLSSNAVFVEE